MSQTYPADPHGSPSTRQYLGLFLTLSPWGPGTTRDENRNPRGDGGRMGDRGRGGTSLAPGPIEESRE